MNTTRRCFSITEGPSRRSVLAMLSLLVLLGLVSSPPAGAAEGSFTGEFLVGYRGVDIGGAERKYAEDLNLDDGPRLFELRFELLPEEALGGVLDSLRLDLSGFGGEPFETLALRAQKFGGFDFRFDRRRSEYIYEDRFLPPELVDISLSTGGDFHHFDFERIQDSARLTLEATEALKLHFAFDRFTRRGESTTTLDIQRDEFELDRVLDESQNVVSLGLEYAWPKVTLVVEGRNRDFENAVEVFLPGRSLGENAGDSAILDFFFLDQPYNATSDEFTARVVAKPTPKLTLRGAASFQALDLDVTSEEQSQGQAFTGFPFVTAVSGSGGVERDVDLVDLDATYVVHKRLSLIGGVWRKELDQQGLFELSSAAGTEANVGRWNIETTGAEIGALISVSPDLTITAGLRQEERDVEEAAAGELEPGEVPTASTHSTDQSGAFVTVGWRPVKALRLTLDYEDTSYDDPFTLASPTDGSRLRLRGRWTLPAGWNVTASVLDRQTENDVSGWDGSLSQADLRVAYRRGRLDLSFGAGRVELDRSIDQTVVTLPGFGGGQQLQFPIDYLAEADFFDLAARCRVTDAWGLGGVARLYDNAGSFPLERSDLRLFAETEVGNGYRLRLGWRTVDYDEETFDFDDYDADIVELGLGYRW